MFRRATIVLLAFSGIAMILWCYFLIHIRPTDVAFIQQKLLRKQSTTPTSTFATTQQQREGVVKEIWFSQEDNSRLHYRIRSESSLLTMKPEGNGFDLIEKLEK